MWFKKMSFMMHCDFDKGSLEINIFKVLFSDGLTKKSLESVTILIILTILG